MKTNRSLLKLILFSLLTLGIYALYFWYKYAQDMNVVCAGDGKKTRGILARIVFTVLTLGIYEFVWMYGAGERISRNAYKRGLHVNTTGGNVLLWYILGAFIIIGPFIAIHKLIDGLNVLCESYNAQSGTAGNINVNVNINR